MSVLSKSIEHISEKSDTVLFPFCRFRLSFFSPTKVNANLADRRVRIEQLNGVRRLLKKVFSFFFVRPPRSIQTQKHSCNFYLNCRLDLIGLLSLRFEVVCFFQRQMHF